MSQIQVSIEAPENKSQRTGQLRTYQLYDPNQKAEVRVSLVYESTGSMIGLPLVFKPETPVSVPTSVKSSFLIHTEYARYRSSMPSLLNESYSPYEGKNFFSSENQLMSTVLSQYQQMRQQSSRFQQDSSAVRGGDYDARASSANLTADQMAQNQRSFANNNTRELNRQALGNLATINGASVLEMPHAEIPKEVINQVAWFAGLVELADQIYNNRRENLKYQSAGIDDAVTKHAYDAGKMRFYDESGLLLGMNYTSRKGLILISDGDTAQGIDIRHQINTHLAIEEVMGSVCAGEKGHSSDVDQACSQFMRASENLKFGYAIADTFAFLNMQGQYKELYTKLESATAFLKGLTVSVLRESAMIGASAALAFLAPELAVGVAVVSIAAALINYGQTAKIIHNFADESYETILNGSAEKRGELLGLLTTQVAAALFPGGLAIKNAQRAIAPAVERAATQTSAERGVQVAVEHNLLTTKAALGINALIKDAPGVGASLLNNGKREEIGNLLATTNGSPNPVMHGFSKIIHEDGEKAVLSAIIESPETAARLGTLVNEAPTNNVASYIAKAGNSVDRDGNLIYKGKDLVNNAKVYLDLESKLPSLYQQNPKTYYLTRGIPANVTLKDGTTIIQNKDQVFMEHPGIYGANNRPDMPGNSALATSFGENAGATVMGEMKGSYTKDQIIFGTKEFVFKKYLDLTVREEFVEFTKVTGYTIEDLTQKLIANNPDAYRLTHMIGDIAAKQGCDALGLPSAQIASGRNMFILNRELLNVRQ